MAIRINLLAESQAAEEMRRRDPVKRAIWIGGFVVSLVLLGVLALQLKITALRSDVSRLEASWKAIENKVKEVDDQRKQAHDVEQKLSALTQFTTNRMLWANVLDTLQGSTVDNIQVVRLRTEQNFMLNEGSKPKVTDTGTTLGKPATVTERVTLVIDGKDFSPRQAEQVQQFKDSLTKAPLFTELLAKTNKVQLTSLTAPQLESGRAYVGFGLQLNFQEKERRLYE